MGIFDLIEYQGADSGSIVQRMGSSGRSLPKSGCGKITQKNVCRLLIEQGEVKEAATC
jgi:hypothetical protein